MAFDCEYCGQRLLKLGTRRPAHFCGPKCRQAAYRRRQKARGPSHQKVQELENVREAAALQKHPPNTPSGAAHSAAKVEFRNAACADTQNTVTDPNCTPGEGFWLWVAPWMEAAHNPKTFDRGDFLAWAVALFQQKERWRGQQPNTARVHPDDFGNGLRLTAEALGLAMLSDPTVTAGTYRLGLVEKREQGNVTCCNHCAEV